MCQSNLIQFVRVVIGEDGEMELVEAEVEPGVFIRVLRQEDVSDGCAPGYFGALLVAEFGFLLLAMGSTAVTLEAGGVI